MSDQSTSYKLYYVAPNENTKIIDNKSYIDFVSDLMGETITEAKKIIELGKITVNGNIVKDINFSLRKSDIVIRNIYPSY